jgi:Uma2 family endonuclease
MATAALNHMTPEEYLAQERQARFRSEFVGGHLLAMVGVSRPHSVLVSALVREIDTQVMERPCDVYSSDMRVKISPTRDYVYPDVVVACEPRFEDGVFDTLVNPVVVMEVLSDSTAGYDRGEKFTLYRRIGSLQEYVLLSQTEVLVEHYVRQGDFWHYTAIDDLDGSLVLASLGIEVPLRRVYTKALQPTIRVESEANS